MSNPTDFDARARIPCEPGAEVRLTKTDGPLGRLHVTVRVDEPPGSAIGVHVLLAPEGASMAQATLASFHPQDVAAPRYLFRDPQGRDRGIGFEGALETSGEEWSGVSKSEWVATCRVPLPEGSDPLRIAVAIERRVPNGLLFAPPSAGFSDTRSWARIVPWSGAWRGHWPGTRPVLPDAAAEDRRDRERLDRWREHLAARAQGGPLETARERLLPSLDAAIAARPDLVALHVVKGDLLQQLGDLEGAQGAYDEALRQGPAFPEAQWARERLRARRWVERPEGEASDYAAAHARIRTESAGIPEGSPAPALAEGLLRYREGEFEAALERLSPFATTHAFDGEIVETVRRARESREAFGQELAFRAQDAAKGDLPRVRLATSEGAVVLELFEDDAGNAVASLVWLVGPPPGGGSGFFDGTTVRATQPFSTVRLGDDPGWAIRSEAARRRQPFRGSVVLEEDGPDTAGGRLALLTGTTPVPEGRGIVIGRVVEGQDVLERLVAGSRIESATLVRRRGHEYRPTTVAGEPAPAPRRR
jgi:cyclophilin family peptidyl-prolyl cis-trans isomerase